MDKVSFTIFTPDGKKFHLTPNWIVIILWTISFALYFFPSKSDLKSYILVGTFCITMYYLTAAFFTYKPLHGTLDGKVIFEKDSIVLNDRTYKLTDIDGLDFSFDNYYGQRESVLFYNANPLLMQGVNNYVTFTDNKNTVHTIYLKMETKQSYLALSPFINKAIKVKKCSLSMRLT